MIGVYGGTFDPPHLGHIHVIRSLLERYSLSKFWIIPTSQNPLKGTPPYTDAPNRLELLKASLAEMKEPRLEIWENEIRKMGPSFTVDTLQAIAAMNSEPLLLTLGADSFNSFSEWKRPNEILELANVCVVKRPGETVKNLAQFLHEIGINNIHQMTANRISHGANNLFLEVIEIHALDFSSTEMREKIAECWNKNELGSTPQGIQRSVWLLIKEKELYRR